MGLDQYIWAEIDVAAKTKRIAMHYWRKNYALDDWFYSRLGFLTRLQIRHHPTVWGCDLNSKHLTLLEAKDHELAFAISFDPELIWRCQLALEEGFRLTYSRDA